MFGTFPVAADEMVGSILGRLSFGKVLGFAPRAQYHFHHAFISGQVDIEREGRGNKFFGFCEKGCRDPRSLTGRLGWRSGGVCW